MWVAPGRGFGVMAIDPGGVTGVAFGAFNWQGSVRETLQAHAPEAAEVRGPFAEQALILYDGLAVFARRCRAERMPVLLAVESFALRQRSVDLAPVEVRSGLATLMTVEPVRGVTWYDQTPADAKSYATSDRLKLWMMYAVGRGSDHKRDALRHLALRVSIHCSDL